MAWSRSVGVVVVVAAFGAAFAPGCSSGGGTPDAGDAALDTYNPPPKDAGADASCTGAVSCEVCDVSAYFPSQMTQPAAHAGACSPGEIQAFVTACGANETSTSCGDWQTAEGSVDAGAADAGDAAADAGFVGGAACLACVFSDQTAARWGVYVCDSGGNCSFNTPGCIDVALGQVSQEKSSGGTASCGDLYNASFGCQDYACGSCTGSGPGSDYEKCTTNAVAHECSAYDAPVESTTGPCGAFNAGDAGVPDGGADPNVCFGATDNDLAAMAALLCGAP